MREEVGKRRSIECSQQLKYERAPVHRRKQMTAPSAVASAVLSISLKILEASVWCNGSRYRLGTE